MDTPPRKTPTSAWEFACVIAAWQAHQGELRGYVRRRVPDEAMADDIVQEVFLKAMSREHALCGIANPRAWLFQVARHALIDRARTAHPAEPLELHEGELLAEPADAPAPVDALADCLMRTLGELSLEDAAILRACDIEGQTQRAFAQAQGLSLPAVKARLLRARRRLRERMSQACQVRFEADGRVASHVARPPPPGPGPIS